MQQMPLIPVMWTGECWVDGVKHRVITDGADTQDAQRRIAGRFNLRPEDVFRVTRYESGR